MTAATRPPPTLAQTHADFSTEGGGSGQAQAGVERRGRNQQSEGRVVRPEVRNPQYCITKSHLLYIENQYCIDKLGMGGIKVPPKSPIKNVELSQFVTRGRFYGGINWALFCTASRFPPMFTRVRFFLSPLNLSQMSQNCDIATSVELSQWCRNCDRCHSLIRQNSLRHLRQKGLTPPPATPYFTVGPCCTKHIAHTRKPNGQPADGRGD